MNLKILYRKFVMVTKIIKLYKTWWLFLLDKYSLLNGIVKLSLRDNTYYLVRAKSNDVAKINEIYIKGVYSEYLDKIRDGAIVIDMGAHIGVFSILAERLAKNVVVYSYEPFTESFDLLKKNIRLNGAETRICAYNLGVTGEGGLRSLFLHTIEPSGNSIYFNRGNGGYVQINTITLKDIFDENNLRRCDLLKMDCEGAEYEILYKTPREYLDRIGSIAMEYHDNENTNTLVRYLKDNGFNVKKVANDHLIYAEKVKLADHSFSYVL